MTTKVQRHISGKRGLLTTGLLLMLLLVPFQRAGSQNPVYGLRDESAPKPEPVRQMELESLTFTIEYDGQGTSVVEGYGHNRAALERIGKILGEGPGIVEKISVTAYAPPEDVPGRSESIAAERASRLKERLSKGRPWVRSRWESDAKGADLEQLTRIVYETPGLSERYEVLAILLDADERTPLNRVRRMYGGRTWERLSRSAFPRMNRAIVRIDYYADAIDDVPVVELDSVTVVADHIPIQNIIASLDTIGLGEPRMRRVLLRRIKRGQMDLGIRTNLLTDMAFTPNIGIEVYAGKGWTILGEWTGGWWSRPRNWFWRPYYATAGFRKYLYNKEDREHPEDHVLSGWHIGLYGQYISYDIMLGRFTNSTGYLSRHSWGAGVEAGYSAPLTKRLNIDFSLGAGYVNGPYYEYTPIGDWYVWQSTNRLHYFGPTRVQISLVWLIDVQKIGK